LCQRKDFLSINLGLIKNNSVSMLPDTPNHRNPQTFPQLVALFVKAQA